MRVNLANNPEEVTHEWGRPFWKRGVYSNGVSSGRIMDLVREMLPGCSINRLALNRDLQTPPHRDPLNVGDFWLLFLGKAWRLARETLSRESLPCSPQLSTMLTLRR